MWHDRVTFAGGLAVTALSQAIIHRIAMEFPEITNYPFALGWSETTRFYLASLFVSKEVYGQQLALPIINPSLHILLVPPYWFDAPSFLADRSSIHFIGINRPGAGEAIPFAKTK